LKWLILTSNALKVKPLFSNLVLTSGANERSSNALLSSNLQNSQVIWYIETQELKLSSEVVIHIQEIIKSYKEIIDERPRYQTPILSL